MLFFCFCLCLFLGSGGGELSCGFHSASGGSGFIWLLPFAGLRLLYLQGDVFGVGFRCGLRGFFRR